MVPPFSDIEWFKPYMSADSSKFRIRLIRDGVLKPECAECGLTKWRGFPAPLQLDHIDGNRANCMRSNLRLLCPNCHALTDTYAGRNIGKHTKERITREVLIREYDSYLKREGSVPSANRLYICLGRLGGIGSTSNRDRIQKLLGDERPLAHISFTRKGRESRMGDNNPSRRRVMPTKIEWPGDAALEELLRTKSRVEVAEMLGVSDNAVKKRCATRGISEPDRRLMRKSTAKVKSPFDPSTITHGTPAGYQLEMRNNIPYCDECREANRVRNAEYRASKRKRELDSAKC